MDKVKILLFALLLAITVNLSAQDNTGQRDSLVRLLEASSAQLADTNGVVMRKIIGPARFLHNNTYLLCDSALWNVNEQVIDAIGNVQIVQDGTTLVGERLKYFINDNLAQFRGDVVTLSDKDNNQLRTQYLDYNTMDSVAVFFDGGVLRSSNNEIIESINGRYDSKVNTFRFFNNVEIFSDSLFAKSDAIDYLTDSNTALFGRNTIAWNEKNMLYADAGEYSREREIFTFEKNAYLFTKEQEVWGDKIVYNRRTGNANLYGNVQVKDTVQSVYMFADKAIYEQDPMKTILTENPAIAMYTAQEGKCDTIFISATDSIKYYTRKFAEVDSLSIASAMARKGQISVDPMVEVERLRQERIRKAREEAKAPGGENDNGKKGKKSGSLSIEENSLRPGGNNENAQEEVSKGKSAKRSNSDSLARAENEAAKAALRMQVMRDDTCMVTFVEAWHNIKLYGNDYQAVCDSVVYSGVDSLARLYTDPVLWSDAKNQFLADSIYLQVRHDSLYRANFINNAFIATQEDSIHYNQVKSTEMMAYFKDNDLWRYDALGGASLIFYFEEDSTLTMINQKECKLLSALVKERKIQKIRYYDQLKSDVIPIYDLPINKQRLRGFSWHEERRPKSRFEVMTRFIRPSGREKLSGESLPEFPYCSNFFPETMSDIASKKEEFFGEGK